MGFFNQLFTRKGKSDFSYQLVLDIGTEYLKAAIVEFSHEEKHILGFGRVRRK